MNNLSKAKAFYNQGLRFLRCSERCMGDINEDGSIQIMGGKYQILSSPTMVNSAFACELFLKTILILHNIDYMKALKKGEGHKLKPLFDLLPNQEYKDYLQIGTKQEFKSELQEHSGDFVDWRYYMEKPGDYKMSPMFTYVLMQNLKTLARALIRNAEEEMGDNNEIGRNM